ncbi:prolyl oligopeptidase family serine peptidase [Sandaracinus amylolyticus]|nr:prolyl oligopeptidase family serine peptidase [Sandaracinus amylolyticus]
MTSTRLLAAYRPRASRHALFALLLATTIAGCGATCPPSTHTTATTAAEDPAPEPTPAAETGGETTPTADASAMVVLDGTPAIPPALHTRLQQYLETRAATAESIAADGSSLLITTRFADTAQVHQVSAPLGDRHQLTFREEPVRAAAFYPNDESAVLYQADVGGSENYQLYRLDRRTGRSTLLTDGTHRHPGFLFSHDGARLAYTSNARNERDIDVWIGDGRAPGQLLVERTGDWHLLDWSRDGARILLLEYVSITDSRIHVLDVATREVRRVSPEGVVAADRAAVFDASGQRAYVASDRGSEFVELYEVDLANPSSEWRPLSRAIPWNVEDVVLSADGRTLVFSTNEDGISVLRTMDTRTRRITAIEGTPRGVVASLVAARGAPVVAVSMGTPTTPTDAYVLDLRRRRLERWTESEIGGLDASASVEPSLIHYESFDGREIPAFYYRARGVPEGQRAPVVVYIHGGPEAQSRPWFIPIVQFLASEAGIAVLVPNVRGSDGYGKGYLALDDGRRREDSVRDIGSLLDWIAQQPELDASRAAVYGGSYGGYMVLASLVHFGDRLRAGVDIVGIANFVTFLENTAAYRRDLRRVEYGDESDPEMREFLSQISPISRVDRIQSALFVAHGANDPRVPASEAEQIVRAVRESGHDVWYMLARNEGHGFLRKENRDVFTELAVMFLEQHLAAR